MSLADKTISFCRGCLACVKTHHCVQHDDAIAIVEMMHDADVIVWAMPIYYYSVSGQMKTMIDRANALYDFDYKFTETYLLAAAAEDELHVVEGANLPIDKEPRHRSTPLPWLSVYLIGPDFEKIIGDYKMTCYRQSS